MRTAFRIAVAVMFLAGCGDEDKPDITSDVGDAAGATETVDGGQEVCTPNCMGKKCGSDGCNGNCGTCNLEIEECDQDGQCVSSGCTSSKDCPGELVCAKDLGECVVCVGEEDCPLGQKCGADHLCHTEFQCLSDKDCKDQGMVCDKDAGICVQCLTPDDCATAEYCLGSYCVDDICTAGESHCDGLDAVTCNDEGSAEEVTDTCSDSQYCDAGECHAQVCPPGKLYCDDNLLHTCDPVGKEVIDTVDCEEDGKVCYQGECVEQSCAPDSAWCLDDFIAASCSEDGMSVTPAPCSFEHYCDDGVCIPWKCGPNSIFCDGEILKVCDGKGSTIESEEDCAKKQQHCFNGSCMETECPPNQEFCQDDYVKAVCAEDGMSSVTEACPAGHYCNEGDAAVQCLPWVCTPGQAFCEDNKAKVCDDKGSAVASEIDCGNGVCVGQACKPVVCGANASSCDGNTVMHCNATGTIIQELEVCGDDQYCEEQDDNAQCKDQICEPGTKDCQGTTVVVCNGSGSGQLPAQNCANSNQVCVDGECSDQLCTPGITFCDGNVVKKCSGDGTSASVVATCGAGQYCGEDGNAAACADQICAPNAKTCQGTKVMECDDVGAALMEVMDCADEGKGCADGGCVEQACGALSLDGTDDYAEIPYSASLNVADAMTVSLWLKPTSVTKDKVILRKGYFNQDNTLFVWLNPSMKMEYGVYIGSNPHVVTSTTSLVPGQWQHFAMTFDGDKILGYLNGQPFGANYAPSGSANMSDKPYRVGYGYPGYYVDAYFNGLVDDLAIWNQALLPNEVLQAGLEGASSVPKGLVGHWKFDQSGVQQEDASGNGNHAVLHGSTWTDNSPACVAGAACSDGIKAPWEKCDDGNALPWDGCTGQCYSEGTGGHKFAGAWETVEDTGMTGQRTYSFWFKPDKLEGIQGLFIKKDKPGAVAAKPVKVFLNQEILGVHVEPEGIGKIELGGVKVGLGWTHVVVQVSPFKATMFVNGVLSGSAALDGTNIENNHDYVVGAFPHTSSWDNQFDGTIYGLEILSGFKAAGSFNPCDWPVGPGALLLDGAGGFPDCP